MREEGRQALRSEFNVGEEVISLIISKVENNNSLGGERKTKSECSVILTSSIQI